MIKRFVEIWDNHKNYIQEKLKDKHPYDYAELVKWVVEMLDEFDNFAPAPRAITCIGDDGYNGRMLFILPDSTNYMYNYWYVTVNYGSCSGCDTLLEIKSMNGYDGKPTDEQIRQYMMLALHIIQRIKKIDPSEEE